MYEGAQNSFQRLNWSRSSGGAKQSLGRGRWGQLIYGGGGRNAGGHERVRTGTVDGFIDTVTSLVRVPAGSYILPIRMVVGDGSVRIKAMLY